MITAGLVGSGKWASKILRESTYIKGFQIKYICSPNINNKKIEGTYIKLADYRELDKFRDINAVIIASSSKSHFKISSHFIKSNTNLFVEKPFVMSLKEALAIKNMLDKRSLVFKIGHIYLKNPAFILFTNKLKKLGKISQIEINFEKKKIEENNKDPLWEWGPHVVSILQEIFQSEPDNFSIIKANKKIIKINLSYKDTNVNLNFGWGIKDLRLVRALGSDYELIFNELKNNKVCVHYGNNIKYPRYSSEPALRVELKAFNESLMKGEKDIGDIETGVNITRQLELFQNEIQKNRLKHAKNDFHQTRKKVTS